MGEEYCAAHASKYPMQLALTAAYHINNTSLQEAFNGFQASLQQRQKASDRRMLFHGTALENAMSIAQRGFQLPKRGGMFGKGIFFCRLPTQVVAICGLSRCDAPLRRGTG